MDCCLTSLKSLLKCYFVTEPSPNTWYKMSTSPHFISHKHAAWFSTEHLPPDMILNLFVVCLPFPGWKITEPEAASLLWSPIFPYAMCWSLNHSSAWSAAVVLGSTSHTYPWNPMSHCASRFIQVCQTQGEPVSRQHQVRHQQESPPALLVTAQVRARGPIERCRHHPSLEGPRPWYWS